MNAKAKGTRAEHRTMRHLEALGYRCTRSAASLGEWDVIAISPNDAKIIQVKCNRWPGSVEMETLNNFPCPAAISREVWRWDDHKRQPQVRYLKKGG